VQIHKECDFAIFKVLKDNDNTELLYAGLLRPNKDVRKAKYGQDEYLQFSSGDDAWIQFVNLGFSYKDERNENIAMQWTGKKPCFMQAPGFTGETGEMGAMQTDPNGCELALVGPDHLVIFFEATDGQGNNILHVHLHCPASA